MFDFEKAAQLAAFFLWLEGGAMKRPKLMELTYLAERRFKAECGAPLTGDAVFHTGRGPGLSALLELSLGFTSDPSWDTWVSCEADYCLGLKKRPAGEEDFDRLNPDARRICKELHKSF